MDMGNSILHVRIGESFDLRFGKIPLDYLPNNLYVDVEIIVDDSIFQPDNFAPLYFRACGHEILRQAIRGFADDFQIAYDGVDGFVVFYECIVILRDIDQILFDDLPITRFDRPARNDFGADSKGVLNAIRELDKTETDLRFDFH